MRTETAPRARARATRLRGALRPVELAEAAVLADATVALCLLGWLLPLGVILVALAVVPMAAVAARHRTRAVVVAGVAGVAVATLVAGVGVASNVATCAALGTVVGVAIRHGWSRSRTVLGATSLLGLPAVAVAIAVLSVLADLRRLALVQVTHAWDGTAGILRQFGLDSVAHAGDTVIHDAVRHWPVTIGGAILAAVAGTTWLAYGLARPTLRRLDHAVAKPSVAEGPPAAADPADPAPVPVHLVDAGYRYPGRHRDALVDVSLTVAPGEFLALVGHNGSGKSTLGRVLAGLPVTNGTVVRDGPAGLGTRGGTAVMFQRPETQVLGVTAADDVLWGLPETHHPDVDALLARVGLSGFAGRETATLSGGELQRLALAAALARRPRLLIADEATAMVDPEGRLGLLQLFRGIAEEGTAVVLITHRAEEAGRADRIVQIENGRLVDVAASVGPARRAVAPGRRADAPLRLQGVGHVYAQHTPWEHRALHDVDLELTPGEGVLVVGRNGSGKSTLAWILAGLTRPSAGDASLGGVPLHTRMADVGLAFQHSRLQLLRETVRADVQAASGTDPAQVDAALRTVGLDPAAFGDRHIDHLSGGEQRRVALAGLVASRPRLLVLDEPFAGLDQAGIGELTAVLARLREETGMTLVVVSHDTDALDGVVEREIRLEAGTVVGARRPEAAAPVARRRGRDETQLLRLVPGTSAVHRLWAGTKLIALVAVAATLSLRPEWPTIGVLGALVGVALLVGRIPRGAVPRLPRWFWIGIGVAAILSAAAGGSPDVHALGLTVGLGAAVDWARATSLALVVLTAAALLSWTTPVASIAPALRRLGAPLRWVRLPVDEWATAVGLAFRCLPLLVEEVRTLAAVRRLRESRHPRQTRGWRSMLEDPQGLLTAALTIALRRGNEFAAAIEARGGLGAFSADHSRPRLRDAVALVIVAGAIALAVIAGA